MSWTLAVLVALVLCSGLFSGGETALFTLSAYQRQLFGRARHGPKRMAARLIRRPDQLLVTLLLGNMTVNVCFFAISSVAIIEVAHRVGGRWGLLLSLLPLVVIILFGEVVPKAVAMTHPTGVSVLVAAPLYVLNGVLAPVRVTLQSLLITPVVRLLSPERAAPEEPITHEELQTLLACSADSGQLDQWTSALLHEVVELRDIKVREVMIPRADVIAFDLAQPREALVEQVHRRRLRMVPVYRQDIDHLCGVISVRELFLYQGRSPEQLVRPALFVPELATIDHLLSTFRERGERLAIVVDEYGGTAGLVTLRDVVEEIVGDLYEATERRAEPVRKVADDEYLVSGGFPIRDWAEFFGQRLELRGVSTVAGLVGARLGRVAAVGDSIRIRNLRLTVEQMDRRRITLIRLKRLDRDAEPTAETAPEAHKA